ncbi:ATP-dependent DNA helicase PIF4 [Zea mays]|uniref:ATP-dependent DNA helicase n=1 Tax=Zea mays TaxID=4577 RepID=A0A3L6G452_MAIZE|nr:ATP-dependent DNA helicase PIF4 [Zea mays]
MPMLFDDYRDEDFYGLSRKYNIVARVEVKFPIEPRYRDSQHFILSDINGSKIEAMTSSYETVKHFDSLINEKHVYKMHNVEFSINLGDRFRHISGPMELYLTRQTVVEPYTVPFQMPPFPKHIFLNLAAIAELPNRTLVDIMAIVVHLDTVQHTMWGNVRKIVVMDARWSLHTIKVWGDLLNKNALRWALTNENYGIIIGTMFRRFRRQEYLESSDYTAIHFNPYHHSTHHFEPIRKALMERGHDRQFAITFLEEKRNPCQGGTVATNGNACMSEQGSGVVHGQTKPRVISNGDDDDEGIIFEEDDDENEGYLFTGQYEGTDEDINIHGTQDESTATDVPDPYDNVYNNIPEETHMLKPVPDCGYCTAKKFEYEPPGFCCRGGKVELAPLETPPQLKSMTTNVRDSGIYTFRAQGMMYHNIKSFGREDQLQRDKEVIRQIVGILRGNPYSEHLRSMGHVENLDDYYIALNLDQTLNQKMYNVPLTSEVAAVWIEGSERRGQFSKSVMLHGKDRSNHGIRSYHGCYDALSYPLFFPKGELGWHANIPKVGVSMDKVDAYRAIHRASNANDEDAESPIHLCVSVRDYYCYKFQIRPGLFNPILHGKRLFQQFAVDTYIKIESSRLDFIRNNQERLRADLYQGLVDSMVDGDISAEKVGKRTVLSPSFIGGPRDMRRRYMDAMALVRKFGKPDIFLTMTCNPNWDEIRRELLPDQTPQDRPDLVVCVFHAKLQELKHRLTKQDILGKVRAYIYVVEFQKRGLPHAHFLLIMQRKYKLTCPEQYDLLISAEIPSNKYPELRKMLQLHLPNMHMVTFHERQMVERVVNRKGVDRSMLTAYFEENRMHKEARNILYRDFPEWYTWQQGKSMGKDINTFPLPAIIDIYDNSHGTDREIYEEECIEPTTEDIALKETLNEEQRSAYDKILSIVDTNNGGVFFVDGPGGTGKTYLYKALLAALCSQDKIAVATATSGVAASIMPGGRTAHSRFKIPLTIDDGAVCSFTKQSGTAKLLQKASLIIWDEASMAKRQAIEALDNSMRDIMGRTGVPFGGKTIVFGGDFRQVLPVVRKGSRAQIVAASLRSSYLWESMCHLKLVRNMRAQSDPWFAEYLLRVGGGTEEENNDGDVRLPDEVCVPYTGNDHDLDRDCPPEFREAVSNLIFTVARYPDLPELCDLRHIFTERYGNFVEHFVSQEFIRKLDSTEFTNEERFQVMHSVDAKKPNIPGQTDHLENKNVLRPVSVRRRTAKLPAPVDAYVEVPNNAKVRRRTNAQITPNSQSKHIGMRNGALNHKNNSGRLMQRMQPEAAETAIDCGNLFPRNANGQMRHNSGRGGDMDEEERMMDKLLMHYRKKGSDLTNNETHTDAVHKVFIPINIRGTHWYLAVINARNMEIQVLDSLGTTFDRNDLTDSYWTGDELSDSFTQDDMSHFRKKLAAILLSSYMNKRRGYPIYKYDKEVHTGSPSDVEILDSPTNHKKRKLLHVLDNSEVLMEDEDGPITQADLQRWFVDEWDKRTPTKVSADGCTDDFLMSGLSTKDMPVTKADLIDVLCDYIMAIQDDRTLEMIWVRSFNPFKIEISVKDLQNILSINLDMTLKCFDMAVRLLANKESRRPKGEIIKNRKHYMDMRFWRMIGFGKLPKYHQDPTTEELTKTLDCWPSMNYYITACKYVSMSSFQMYL